MLTLPERLNAVSEPLSLKALKLILALSERYSYVPISVIERGLNVSHELTVRSLENLVEFGLVRSSLKMGEYAYQLTFAGLDVLATVRLMSKGYLSRVGPRLFAGKESEIYVAWSPSGSELIIKFHREGARSFRSLRRTRHYGRVKSKAPWIIVAKESASREFRALAMLSRLGCAVPKPITLELHGIVMEYLNGTELSKASWLSKELAEGVLNDIINTIRIAYRDGGIVHGDLSPYNILIVDNGGNVKGYVIDWPQYVDAKSEVADELLYRDLDNIATYFNKSFGLNVSAEDLLKRVKGEQMDGPTEQHLYGR